jgi:SNF2 family DNA or RNA helicase
MLKRKRIKLYRFQREDIRRLRRMGDRAIVGHDMGLGKTLMILMRVKKRLLKKGPVVVVCPKTAIYTWQQQAWDHVGVRAVVLETRTPQKDVLRSMAKRPHRLYLVNYEILRFWLPHLIDLDPVALVGDEVQRLKNPGTKWTKAMMVLAEGTPHLIFAGGTGGVENSPLDLWPMLRMLGSKKWPRKWRALAENRTRFMWRFCVVRKTPWGIKIERGKNLKELHDFLREFVLIRRRTKDVLKDLPPRSQHVVLIPLEDYKEYNAIEDEAREYMVTTADSGNNSEKYMEATSRFWELMRCCARLKLKAVKEWIDAYLRETKDKLICFGVHKIVVRGLHLHYGDGIATRVDGSVRGDKRTAAFDRFNGRKKCRLFFGNIKAAGESWSCKGTSTGVMVELYPNPSVHNQAEKRIHGIGRGVKGSPTRWFYLIAKNTIEEKLVRILTARQDVQDKILDGGRGGEGFRLYDLLKELLTKEKR